MKLALLADIHAILTPLQALLAELDREPVDAILVAGDMISGGPQPNEVLTALAERGAIMVIGNHEERVLRFRNNGLDPVHAQAARWAFTRWTARHLSPVSYDLLFALPDERWIEFPGCAPIHLMHGAPWNLLEGWYFPDLPLFEQALGWSEAAVLTTAHSHYQWAAAGLDGRLVINPGAVGPASNGTPGAHYARLKWDGGRWQVDLRSVSYDPAPIRPAFESSGFLAEGGALARGWMETTLCGVDIIRHFFDHFTRVLHEQGLAPGAEVPDALWREIEASFDWSGPFPQLNPVEPSGIVEGRVSTRRRNV